MQKRIKMFKHRTLSQITWFICNKSCMMKHNKQTVHVQINPIVLLYIDFTHYWVLNNSRTTKNNKTSVKCPL